MVAMGNTHDFRLFKQSKLPLKRDTLVYVDTGYLGMKKLHQNIEIPKKNTKLNPLSKEDRLKNRNISLKRIPVEHINAKIKTFKILSQRYRNRRKRFGLRLNLICALINFDKGFGLE